MRMNIEEKMFLQRQRGQKALCPKFLSIRKEFVGYVREKARLLKLSRESCQLVFYYMDEYYSRCEYKQEETLRVFSSFFILSSKVV